MTACHTFRPLVPEAVNVSLSSQGCIPPVVSLLRRDGEYEKVKSSLLPTQPRAKTWPKLRYSFTQHVNSPSVVLFSFLRRRALSEPLCASALLPSRSTCFRCCDAQLLDRNLAQQERIWAIEY